MKKKRNPFTNLLLIPATLIAGIFLIFLGTILDARLFAESDALFPVFTLIIGALACIIFVIMFIISIVRTVKGLRNRSNK